MQKANHVANAASYLLFVLTVLAMVATPLFARGSEGRRVLANVVVCGLCGVGLLRAWRMFRGRAVVAAGAVMVFTLAVEIIGSTTGYPFGSYSYTGMLTPQLLGVPIIVCVAWAGITLVVHGVFSGAWRSNFARAISMSLAITAWDVFLDPQMVAEGYWTWEPTTVSFRGIPIVNYLGWLLTALVASGLVVSICRRSRRTMMDVGARGTSAELSGTAPVVDVVAWCMYATIAALSTIGFLFFFDDVVVAAVGAVAMGCWVLVGWRLLQSRPEIQS